MFLRKIGLNTTQIVNATKKMWQNALNGSFHDGVRLVDNQLVSNGRWCDPTLLVHRLLAENHDTLHLTTSSVEKHRKELNHAWKVKDCTKQWNCNAKRVTHVPFTHMTPSVSKGT